MNTRDKAQIILNAQEIGLRTDKTNCRTRGREELTCGREEVERCGLGEKRIAGTEEGEGGALVTERDKREEHIGECTRETLP